MSRICPQCGNLNSDEMKFCTACGSSFREPADQSASLAKPQDDPAAPGAQPHPTRLRKSSIGAGIAGIVIIILFLVLVNSGIAGNLPVFKPPVTTHTIAQPVVSPGVVSENPTPGLTHALTENMPITKTVPGTSPTSAVPTKALACSSDLRACGGNCTDIRTDRSNCGACGVTCSSLQSCQLGRCAARCNPGETSCFDGCHDLLYDAQNCGTCANACPVGLVCNRSVCSPPLPTVIQTYTG